MWSEWLEMYAWMHECDKNNQIEHIDAWVIHVVIVMPSFSTHKMIAMYTNGKTYF